MAFDYFGIDPKSPVDTVPLSQLPAFIRDAKRAFSATFISGAEFEAGTVFGDAVFYDKDTQKWRKAIWAQGIAFNVDGFAIPQYGGVSTGALVHGPWDHVGGTELFLSSKQPGKMYPLGTAGEPTSLEGAFMIGKQVTDGVILFAPGAGLAKSYSDLARLSSEYAAESAEEAAASAVAADIAKDEAIEVIKNGVILIGNNIDAGVLLIQTTIDTGIAFIGTTMDAGIALLGATIDNGVALLGVTIDNGIALFGRTLADGLALFGRTVDAGVVLIDSTVAEAVTLIRSTVDDAIVEIRSITDSAVVEIKGVTATAVAEIHKTVTEAVALIRSTATTAVAEITEFSEQTKAFIKSVSDDTIIIIKNAGAVAYREMEILVENTIKAVEPITLVAQEAAGKSEVQASLAVAAKEASEKAAAQAIDAQHRVQSLNTVAIEGSAPDASYFGGTNTIQFTLPRGPKGDPGTPGGIGDKGPPGDMGAVPTGGAFGKMAIEADGTLSFEFIDLGGVIGADTFSINADGYLIATDA